jgi:hypothetical protein
LSHPTPHTFWDVSTAHITADDAKLLEADLGPVHYTYAEGFFIPVPDEIEQALADMEEQGFSADAIALLRKSSETGIDLLRLDRDADTYTAVARVVSRDGRSHQSLDRAQSFTVDSQLLQLEIVSVITNTHDRS